MSVWRPRLRRVAYVVIAAAIATTCVRSNTERCADGSRCPQGAVCVDLEGADSRCARSDQFEACAGVESGTCSLGNLDGLCLGGACFVPICGDGVIDPPEVCDDANTLGGDGCAATCRSDETCGNGVVDLNQAEQCDDGAPGRAGDGCSKSCIAEYRLWRDVSPGVPHPRAGYGLAQDPIEGHVLFGGTAGTLSSLAGGSNTGTAPFDDTWRWTGTTWLPVDSANSPSPRHRFAMTFDAARRRVLLFGGIDASGNRLADTWEWDGVTWTERTPLTKPPPRSDASLACDANRCVLHGGVDDVSSGPIPSSTYHEDTWSWDGSTWTLIATGQPPGRGRSAIAYDAERRTLVLFGGESGTLAVPALHNDTYLLAEGATSWTSPIAIGLTPPVSASDKPATAAFEPTIKMVMLVTGQQTWRWNGAGWDNVSAAVPADLNPTAVLDPARQRITLIGQISDQSNMIARNWVPPAWTVTPAFTPTGGARSLAAAYDTRRGRSVILDRTSGTFEWNGAGWRFPRTLAQGPPGMYGATLAYDARCGVTVSLGGGVSPMAAPADQMWTYDGMLWTEVTQTRPLGRIGHAMAYDVAHDAIVVFGGRTGGVPGGQLRDELWIWSGPTCTTRSWRQIAVTGSWPSARTGATIGYDQRRQRVVLFGGIDSAGTYLDDTWELDGEAWTQLASTSGPAARAEHAMAYDPRRERIVMFGGRDAAGVSDDTWEWDGDAGAWRQLATVLSVSSRSGLAMTHDVTGSVIAIGGENQQPQGVPIGPFRLRSELSLERPETCLDSIDTDGDGLAGCGDPDCAWRCAPLCAPNTSCASCGDATCSLLEDHRICAADCDPPGP